MIQRPASKAARRSARAAMLVDQPFERSANLLATNEMAAPTTTRITVDFTAT